MALKLIKPEKKNPDDNIILKNLNDEQLKAVTHIDGPVLIVAGAGSGKTRVLTHRVAYLLEQGVNPYNVLALTFTNKAAGEMKERITKLVSPEAGNKIWAGTFHSVFARILRYEAETLGYTSSFSIYDTDDSLSLMKRIMVAFGISQQNYNPTQIRSKISWAKNQMMDYAEFEKSAKNSYDKIAAQLFKEYETELKRANSMDFDDLLLNMINVLNSSPETLEKYQDRFKYLLVDEYQDTNRPQYIVCNLLARKYKNICVVGDDAQSIYKWRGADIRNILDFQKDYPTAEVIRLERNYRSTANILAAAGSVIKNNRKQIPKNLWTERHEGEKIKINEYNDDAEEASKIITKIKSLMSSTEYTPKDFAVLYRTNAQSLAFENACRRLVLPYIIVGGQSFYKRKEVKDVLAYLKIIINPNDGESFLRILNEPPRGIGPTSLEHLKKYARLYGISIFEAFRHAGEIPDLQLRAKNAVKTFIDLLQKHRELKQSLPGAEFAKKYIDETGLLQMYKEIGTDEADDRWNNIQQVINDISQFFKNEPDKELEDYLQQISLMSEVDEKDISREQIKLMTLHSAKGLEFPVVFIAGMEKGLFPFERSENSGDEEEEERRLFYVGITRAMEQLYITHANRRMRFGEFQFQSPSKFLNEIDRSIVNRGSGFDAVDAPIRQALPKQPVRIETNFHYSQIPSDESYSQIPVEEKAEKLKPGDKVRHKNFGDGKVELISGIGDNKQATVYFKGVGRKKLVLQYAKLERIG